MTISDADLESGLRDLRYRTHGLPLDPHDLVRTARARHRQHRRRGLVLAVATAAAVVLAGVPVVRSGLAGDRDGQTARPEHSTTHPAAGPGLYDLPTRGSLAGDGKWLDAMAARSWGPVDPDRTPGSTETPPATRHVAFAGDVRGIRMALLLGTESGSVVHTWFTGAAGAAPADMQPATAPADLQDADLAALWEVPAPDSGRRLLVAFGPPGAALEFLAGLTVSPDGSTEEDWLPLSSEDGVAVHEEPSTDLWPVGAVRVAKRTAVRAQPDLSDRAMAAMAALPAPADPRKLTGTFDPEWPIGVANLPNLAQQLLNRFRLPRQLPGTTLLAAGPVPGSTPETFAVLVGATLPSGATVALVEVDQRSGAASWIISTAGTRPAPAGADLLDRVIAVPLPTSDQQRSLAVSGPGTGVTAEILSPAGNVLATIRLSRGGGFVTLEPQAVPDSVRIRDAAGTVVATGPVAEILG